MKRLTKIFLVSFLGVFLISATPKQGEGDIAELKEISYVESSNDVKMTSYYSVTKSMYTYIIVDCLKHKTGESYQIFKSATTYMYANLGTFYNTVTLGFDDSISEGVTFILTMYQGYSEKVIGSYSAYYIPKKYTDWGKNKILTEEDADTWISTGYEIDKYINYQYTPVYDYFQSSSLEDIHVLDLYNRYSIDYFTFNFLSNVNDFTDATAYFHFYYPYQDYFTDFPNDGHGNFTLGLNVAQLDKETGLYRFYFEDYFYYDPITHEPYYNESSKEGLIKTECIYFPINKKEQFEGMNCSIDIVIYEIEATYTTNFSISFLKDLLGECNSAQYCVLTNEDKNENYQEKVVEITYA